MGKKKDRNFKREKWQKGEDSLEKGGNPHINFNTHLPHPCPLFHSYFFLNFKQSLSKIDDTTFEDTITFCLATISSAFIINFQTP